MSRLVPALLSAFVATFVILSTPSAEAAFPAQARYFHCPLARDGAKTSYLEIKLKVHPGTYPEPPYPAKTPENLAKYPWARIPFETLGKEAIIGLREIDIPDLFDYQIGQPVPVLQNIGPSIHAAAASVKLIFREATQLTPESGTSKPYRLAYRQAKQLSIRVPGKLSVELGMESIEGNSVEVGATGTIYINQNGVVRKYADVYCEYSRVN